MPTLIMIKRLFITLCLLTIVSLSVYADEPSVKISLGIRDTSRWTTHTNVAYPLGFRIENTAKTAIKGDDIAGIFAKGIIHILPNDGQEQHHPIADEWNLKYGFVPNDLQPGETSECKLVLNIITSFPSAKDGDYQVWWTLGDSKSNVLPFTVTNGKVSVK